MTTSTITREHTDYSRDFDALAMAIEDGVWVEHDPRAEAIVNAARAAGLQLASFDVYADQSVPTPVRVRAFASIAGRFFTQMSQASGL